MNAHPTTDQQAPGDALAQLSAIPMQMIDAWNHGDATAFAAAFADDAEFVAFEGTILPGRDAIIAFHQPLFDTVLKGSRLVDGDVRFVRVFEPGWGIVHSRLATVLPGQDASTRGRDSMQLYVARRIGDRWEVVAMQNSRLLDLDRQQFLDDVDALPAEISRRLSDLASSVAHMTSETENS